MSKVDPIVNKILEGASIRSVISEATSEDVYKVISDATIDFIKSLDGADDDDWYVQASGYDVWQTLQINSVKAVGDVSDLNFEIDAEFTVSADDVEDTDDWNENVEDYEDEDEAGDPIEFAKSMGWCGSVDAAEIISDKFADDLIEFILDALAAAGLKNTVVISDISAKDSNKLHVVVKQKNTSEKEKVTGSCTFLLDRSECKTKGFTVTIAGKKYQLKRDSKEALPCNPGDVILIDTGTNKKADFTCIVPDTKVNIDVPEEGEITHLSFVVPESATGEGTFKIFVEDDYDEGYYIYFTFGEPDVVSGWCLDIDENKIKVY